MHDKQSVRTVYPMQSVVRHSEGKRSLAGIIILSKKCTEAVKSKIKALHVSSQLSQLIAHFNTFRINHRTKSTIPSYRANFDSQVSFRKN